MPRDRDWYAVVEYDYVKGGTRLTPKIRIVANPDDGWRSLVDVLTVGVYRITGTRKSEATAVLLVWLATGRGFSMTVEALHERTPGT